MTTGWDFSNPTSPVQRTIAYNTENMPLSVNRSGTVTTFTYDGDNRRVKKTANGSTTYYIGDHFEVEGSNEIKYIFAGNLRIAKIDSSGVYYFHKDHLGSSTVMTNDDGVGSAETAEYDPFGGMRSHSSESKSNYKYTDQELDAETPELTGLYNYNARLYDPAIGRFISADPVVPHPYNPQSLNRYSYVLNNPLIYTDPSGYQAAVSGGEYAKEIEGNKPEHTIDPIIIEDYHLSDPSIRNFTPDAFGYFSMQNQIQLEALATESLQAAIIPIVPILITAEKIQKINKWRKRLDKAFKIIKNIIFQKELQGYKKLIKNNRDAAENALNMGLDNCDAYNKDKDRIDCYDRKYKRYGEMLEKMVWPHEEQFYKKFGGLPLD